MECPISVTIKKEHDIDWCENADDLLNIDFETNVKIEKSTLLEEDWCLENNDLLPEIDEKFLEIDNYKCDVCAQSFAHSHLLYQHNLKHLAVMLYKEIIYECDLCSARYFLKEQLIYHIRVKHKNKPKRNLNKLITKSNHRCTICKKSFKYSSWYYHMMTVHAKRSEKCTQCGHIFKCNRYLQRHVKCVHEGIKPNWRKRPAMKYEVCTCDECGKKFDRKAALTTHKTNCHSDRTYQCYICKSVLKCKSYLMAHIRRVHYYVGIEHACIMCHKSFKSPTYLKVHVKNSHSKPKGRL